LKGRRLRTINQSMTFICQYAKVTHGGLPEKPIKLMLDDDFTMKWFTNISPYNTITHLNGNELSQSRQWLTRLFHCRVSCGRWSIV